MTRKTEKRLTPEATLTIGLDIGYGVTKAVTDKAVLMFPSVCGYAREIKFRPEDLAKRYPGDQLSDDGDWFVGDLALSQVPTAELLRLRGRTADNDSIGNAFRLRMAKVAIGKLLAGQHGGDVVHIRIATGLPVDHMPQAAALKETLTGTHAIRTDGADVVANITNVMVMPQPYGCIYANMLTESGKLNPCHTAVRTGVVDVGTYTVDLALDNNGEYIDAQSGSVEGGVHTAQERIADFLERTYQEKPDYRDVEKVLRTGCYTAFGRTVDYRHEAQGWLEPLRSATLNLMGEKWRTGHRIDVIYLSGGGAPLVHEAVSRAYEQVQLVKDAQLANARGYLNYATFVETNPV